MQISLKNLFYSLVMIIAIGPSASYAALHDKQKLTPYEKKMQEIGAVGHYEPCDEENPTEILLHAIHECNFKKVQTALEAGANVNAPVNFFEDTMLNPTESILEVAQRKKGRLANYKQEEIASIITLLEKSGAKKELDPSKKISIQ